MPLWKRFQQVIQFSVTRPGSLRNLLEIGTLTQEIGTDVVVQAVPLINQPISFEWDAETIDGSGKCRLFSMIAS